MRWQSIHLFQTPHVSYCKYLWAGIACVSPADLLLDIFGHWGLAGFFVLALSCQLDKQAVVQKSRQPKKKKKKNSECPYSVSYFFRHMICPNKVRSVTELMGSNGSLWFSTLSWSQENEDIIVTKCDNRSLSRADGPDLFMHAKQWQKQGNCFLHVVQHTKRKRWNLGVKGSNFTFFGLCPLIKFCIHICKKKNRNGQRRAQRLSDANTKGRWLKLSNHSWTELAFRWVTAKHLRHLCLQVSKDCRSGFWPQEILVTSASDGRSKQSKTRARDGRFCGNVQCDTKPWAFTF